MPDSVRPYTQFLATLPVAALLHGPDGTLRYANAAAAALLDIPAGATTGSAYRPLGDAPGEFEVVRRDGTIATLAADVSAITLGDGAYRLSILRDVGAARASERRFAVSQRFANIGTWEWDIRSGELYWSDRIGPLFGYPEGELETTYENFLAAVHRDDRDRVVSAIDACIAGDADYDMEHRVVWPDGSLHWMHERGDVVRDAAGRPQRMLGVVQDVTLRKTAELRLQLVAKVIENTPEAVVITDADQRIISTNPAFTGTTGYSAAEAVGQRPSMLSSGRHDAAFYREMWERLRRDGQWQGEIWNRRKNGDIYPEWLNINAIRDDDGTVTNYAAIFSDLSTQEHVRKRLHHLAYYDVLTDLANRELFLDRLHSALALARRDCTGVGLMFLDLDRFKTINDSLGHPVGDGLLQAVAARLTAAVRETDTVARLGGDEFTVIVDDVSSPEALAHVAEAVLTRLREPIVVAGHDLFITSSIGLAVYPGDGETPDLLVKHADVAMYRAKELGRNNYQFYTREMSERSGQRLLLENELRKAVDAGYAEFHLLYQPQVAVGSGSVVGVEALLRWENGRLGRVPPDRFIGVAEDTGLIGALGGWVLRTALAQLRRWLDSGLELRMAINVSGRQLNDPGFVDSVAAGLAELGLPPGRVELELTESVLMGNAAATIATIAALHRLGVRFAVDDFGTGYSSLAYLKRFQIDQLKIDKSFVDDITVDENDATIAATIVAMGHRLGLEVVAEGVETAAQYQFLAGQGCDCVQGYLFSRPLSPADLEQFVRQASAAQAIDSLA
jgi:diguanylate cyclase (GGDEF)-like protein/PAS domain S-box-containing protein